ncbi:MAG: Hsp20/alpha crystallin family protein [Deferribacteraceae bacterium]|jgi:HSP20 family protein|nr:Hsp20/alpha crystallin family protein [Deferribacteraceae bacterium]
MSIRYSPLRDILSIHDRLNTLFQDNPHEFIGNSGEWQPLMDMFETDAGFVILAEIPGTPEDAIDVQIANGCLTIKGCKPSSLDNNSDKFSRIERNSGRFSRTIAIPQSIDPSSVDATLKDGVLKIALEKNTAAVPRSVKVVKQGD